MSTFEFISVFISIIFGLGLAHLATNAMTHVFQRKISYERAAYLLFMTTLLLVQWWTLSRWRDFDNWTFEAFAIMALWALMLFAMPVALYPPNEEVGPEIKHRRTLFVLFALNGAFEIAQTAILGQLFNPWYYLIFMGQFYVVIFIGMATNKPSVHKAIATYIAAILILWVFVVRRFLA